MYTSHGSGDGSPSGTDEAGGATQRIVVGILADPDLPASAAWRAVPWLRDNLSSEVAGHDVEWDVAVTVDPFESVGPTDSDLLGKARHRVHTTSWDLAVGLTDVPVPDGHESVLTGGEGDAVAVVSMPALGGPGMQRRCAHLLRDLIHSLAHPLVRGRNPDTPTGEPEPSVPRVATRPFGRLRVLLGMVQANRPWALTTGLMRSLAGGLAGSAFGVLYSNIWTLADSMTAWRLAVCVVGAVGVHAGWLLTGHRLLERRGHPNRDARLVTLRNMSTVLTVLGGVTVYTAALFVLALAALLVAVSPAYLVVQLTHPVGPVDYLSIALLATAVGTVAGAIGSGLEDERAVRSAAYGHREIERERYD